MSKNKIISKGTGNVNLQDLDIGRDLTIIQQIDLEELTGKITKQKDDEIIILREEISLYKENKNLSEEKLSALQIDLSTAINERDVLEEQVKKFAEELKGKNFSASGKLYSESIELFLEGKLDEALEALDESKLKEEEKKNSEARILKARLLSLKFKFDEAEENLLRAIHLFPGIKSYYATAHFYYYLKRYTKAKVKAKKAYQYSKSEEEKVICLKLLGDINFCLNFNEGVKTYKELIDLLRKLAEKEPQTFLPSSALYVCILAMFYEAKNNISEAKKNYLATIEILIECESLMICDSVVFFDINWIENRLNDLKQLK